MGTQFTFLQHGVRKKLVRGKWRKDQSAKAITYQAVLIGNRAEEKLENIANTLESRERKLFKGITVR